MMKNNNSILVEKRLPTQSFANELLIPGGHVEENELKNPKYALIREIKEELGIIPLIFEPVPCSKIIGETGKILIPYLITSWKGNLPDKVLDKGNLLLWKKVEDLEKSPLLSVRQI